MKYIFDTNEIASRLQSDNSNYYRNILQANSLEAGILVLNPGETDTQESHSLDEIYFVIEGNGYVQISNDEYPIKKGICLFVPCNTIHRFFNNPNTLIILYVLGKS